MGTPFVGQQRRSEVVEGDDREDGEVEEAGNQGVDLGCKDGGSY